MLRYRLDVELRYRLMAWIYLLLALTAFALFLLDIISRIND